MCSIQGQGSGGLGNLLSRSEVAGRVSKRVSSEWEIKGSVVTIFIVFITSTNPDDDELQRILIKKIVDFAVKKGKEKIFKNV